MCCLPACMRMCMCGCVCLCTCANALSLVCVCVFAGMWESEDNRGSWSIPAFKLLPCHILQWTPKYPRLSDPRASASSPGSTSTSLVVCRGSRDGAQVVMFAPQTLLPADPSCQPGLWRRGLSFSYSFLVRG